MKVLHLNSNYLYTKLHEELINRLNTYKIDNTIFMPLKKNMEINNFSENKLFAEESFKEIDRYMFFHKEKKIYNKLQEKLNNFDFDLIHAHTLFTDGNIAYRLYEEIGLPYIVTVRSTDIYTFFKKRILLRRQGIKILENAAYIVFLSDSAKNELLNKFIPSEKKTKISKKSKIIPNGISNFWFDNMNPYKKEINPNSIKLIYVGTIIKRKNITTTLESIKMLKNEDYRISYTIIGEAKNQKLLNEIKKKSSEIKNLNLTIIPHVDKTDLIKYYRESDIFVMPSHTETFGLVYPEALSQGLPIIYTKDQGFDKQFEEGIVGFSVDSSSPKDIADKIKKIINNYEYISYNTTSNLNKFNWEVIAEKYWQLYRRV